MDLPLQEQIEAKYAVLEKITEGGMGTIYKVRHRLLDDVRVIKVMRPQLALDARLRHRFEREAKMAIRLRHPNIAQVYDYAVAERGFSFIVMEYIEGVTLQEVLTHGGSPSVGLGVELARQSLLALSYLHDNGFVHRDISPDNLMLTRGFDGGPLVKLIDLGLARESSDAARITESGMFLGKVRYASPEQFEQGSGQAIGPSRDLYALGILLYELLTGRPPFTGDTFAAMAASHLFYPPLDFSQSDPDDHVPEELRAIVLEALEKDPADRIPSAEAFIERLERFRSPVADGELEDVLHRAAGGRSRLEAYRDSISVPPGAGDERRESGGEGPPGLGADHPSRRPARRTWAEQPRWRTVVATAALLLVIGVSSWLVDRRSSIGPEGGSPRTESPAAPGAAADAVQAVPATSPRGRLALDALPWARVESIVDAEGRRFAPGASPFTPLHVELPIGTYTITLANPSIVHPAVIEVEIRKEETTHRVVPLAPADVESYFEREGTS